MSEAIRVIGVIALWIGLLAAIGLIVGVATAIVGGVAWLVVKPVIGWLA